MSRQADNAVIVECDERFGTFKLSAAVQVDVRKLSEATGWDYRRTLSELIARGMLAVGVAALVQAKTQ